MHMTTHRKRARSSAGFSLVEMVFSVLVLGIIMVALAGVFILFQKSSASTNELAQAQQNARIAVDFITDYLRQAGSSTDYFRGQRPIVHAGPFQVAINADIDNGRTIDGQGPLTAINIAYMPRTVPPSGTIIYFPSYYLSNAETIVLTLDSNDDGVVNGGDRGDDAEEAGLNTNLFMLRRVVYGFNGARNEVRASNLAIVRGPNLNATWTVPQPLFQYFYDHDDNSATPDRLWGDSNLSGRLETAEILALGDVPSSQLHRIRKIKTTATAESSVYNKRYESNGGFLAVDMTSEVNVRNATRTSSSVSGRVFHDADSDGVVDVGEAGIYNVEIRLAGQNRSTRTDNFGSYYLPLPPGSYSIQEVDPAGYTSTTANLVSVTLASGQASVVNFGDRSVQPSGKIHGHVYADVDVDGAMDPGEDGLASVLITLDNGSQTFTDGTGYYAFIVQRGTYNVVETDLTGYSSTTPNSRSVTINGNDSVTVNFGDFGGAVTGTLQGYVYLDDNLDGIRNSGEEGLPNVTLHVSNGDSTTTNASGYFRFSLTPGTYSLVEQDPTGYTSTTVNTFTNIVIAPDTFVTRFFGDILETRTDFVEIHISNTDRVLSVTTADLVEDGRNDADIILGTALVAGVGNMLVFQNKWESATTPVTELFDPDPTYRRDAGQNINSLVRHDLSGDGVPDVMTGLDCATSSNMQYWPTQSGGVLATTPPASYLSSGSNAIMDLKLDDFDNDGVIDMVAGLQSSFGTFTGGFEVFRGIGGGSFSSAQYITHAGPLDVWTLGEIWAVESGDIDGDGDKDIVIGSHDNAFLGHIDVFENTGLGSMVFAWRARYQSFGAVNDLEVLDMKEDDQNDPDIIAATAVGTTTGMVLLWLNTAGTFGLPDTTGYAFDAGETPNMPDDWVNAAGAALCLAPLNVNGDIFPDIMYGVRSSLFYGGDIYLLPAYGTLPPSGLKINQSSSGEIIAMDVSDFNKDNLPDLVVGTRTSATQGKLVAYFGRNQ